LKREQWHRLERKLTLRDKTHLLCFKEELLNISYKLFAVVKLPLIFKFYEIPEIVQELINIINDKGIKSELSSFSEKLWVQRLLAYPALAKSVLKKSSTVPNYS
jgi:hypothetical protein